MMNGMVAGIVTIVAHIHSLHRVRSVIQKISNTTVIGNATSPQHVVITWIFLTIVTFFQP